MHYNAARPHQGIAQRVPDSQHHPPRVTALSGALPGNARQTDSYVIAVTNQKDGVGKTMVTLSLAAHTVAAYGRALVVDVDHQANAHDLTRAMWDPGYEVVHESGGGRRPAPRPSP